jgi:hypothetical protein
MAAKQPGRVLRPGRRGWLALLAFIFLGASHLVAGVWLGRAGTFVTAVLAEIAWLLLRPWRWAGSTPTDCRFLGWAGAAALGIFVLIAAWLYRWPPG